MEKQPAVYILASGRNGTLYIGVTSDLVQRAWQHRSGAVAGFSLRYDVKHLVHYELHGDMEHAITRERRLKKWDRAWKVRLIEERNPEWRDLWGEILGVSAPENTRTQHRHPREGGGPGLPEPPARGRSWGNGSPGFPPSRE